MGQKKFTWVIKDFSSKRSEIIYSDKFVIDGCKWRLMAYPKGDRNRKYLSLYLDVADSESLPCGWYRHVWFNLKVSNQLTRNLSVEKGKHNWFDQKTLASGFVTMIPLSELLNDEGFLVNGELKIVVEIDLLKVIGKVDVSEEFEDEYNEESEKEAKEESDDESNEESEKEASEESGDESEGASNPLPNDDLNTATEEVKETIDVNGFEVLPSKVKSVSRILEKYPDVALGSRAKSPHLKTACMNVLVGLVETLRQSLQELSEDDLREAGNALAYVKDAGFKVGLMEKKLEEVKKKKKEEQIGETRTRELEKELKDLKQKCLGIESLLEKEKASVS